MISLGAAKYLSLGCPYHRPHEIVLGAACQNVNVFKKEIGPEISIAFARAWLRCERAPHAPVPS
jgi:hypothetical protein